MKKSIFVGGTDKLDILIYIASIIQGASNSVEKKVILVDFTDMQKARYIVPAIELAGEKPDRYITTHQKIDIAVGYKSYDELIENGVIIENQGAGNYEYAFFNVDNETALGSIPINPDDLVFLMTSFDIYSIEKAIEAFKAYNSENLIHKIFISQRLTRNHDIYLQYLFGNTNVKFADNMVNFPFDTGDLTVIYENQRAGRLELKPFSKEFKNALREITEFIASNMEGINKHMKELEKN